MRVALVTETFPPEVNGVAFTLARLADELRDRGHVVDLIRPRQASDGQPARPDGETGRAECPRQDTTLLVPGLPLPGYPGLRFGLPSVRRVAQRFEQAAPDVVHVATEGPLGVAASWVARRMRIPVVSSFHTNFHRYGGYYGLGALRSAAVRYLRAFHQRTHCTLAPCADAAERLTALGFRRVGEMGRGVDTVRFDPARRSPALRATWQAGRHDPVVLYAGRLAAEKNLDLAIRTFYSMQVEVPRARFVLVGDGPLYESLRREHPGFIFCGTQRGTALAEHFASADIFLFPSLTDTFGNVVLEAMASGLAVVAFDTAAARNHIAHLDTGVKAPCDRPDLFMALGRTLIARPKAVRYFGRRARAACRELTWNRVAARVEGFYTEAVRARAGRLAPLAPVSATTTTTHR